MDKDTGWIMVGYTSLIAFAFGFAVGSVSEQLKDTPHVMHCQKVSMFHPRLIHSEVKNG